MSEDVSKVLKLLEEAYEVDDKGRLVVRFGLIATLYFHKGHNLEKREAVLECFNEYMEMCGEHLRWWVVEGGHFGPVAKLKSRDMAPYLLSPKFAESESERPWAFFWHGGEHKEDASHFRIHAFGDSRMESDLHNQLSYCSVSFPLTWFATRSSGLPSALLRWSQRLQPFHGYAGIGIINAADSGLAANNEKKIYAIAQRFPGMEVDYPLDHSLWTKKGIKGGNWITMLSNFWVEELGGVDALHQQLGEPFQIDEYVGGVMILAGLVPEIGDRNRQIDTPNYRKLSHVLKPIRTKLHPGVHGSRGKFNRQEFEAWLARFDD